MSNFVLVHGACHGAWCWYKVAPLLERLGHTVICPDLPSHGRDRTPLEEISLARYSESIVAIVEKQSQPVTLVGHSLGGAVISEAARQLTGHVQKLVYVTAFLLEGTQTIHEMVATDTDSILVSAFDLNAEMTVATPNPDGVGPAFYNDCSPEDAFLAKSLLSPVSPAPNDEAISEWPSGAVEPESFYIECTLDRALTISAQRAMNARLPRERIITLEAGHSPFFSMPNVLAAHLHALNK